MRMPPAISRQGTWHCLFVVLAVPMLVASTVGCTRNSKPAVEGGAKGTTLTTNVRGSAPLPSLEPGTTREGQSGPISPSTINVAVSPRGETIDGAISTSDGRDRSYHLYVPSSLPETDAVPLLLALHGGTGWGQQFERNSGFDGLAEANDFLVVYPDGITIADSGPFEGGRVWNGGYCCGRAAEQEVDDVAFLSMVIDEISVEYKVDPKRVYVAGHSNGAIMAYRLACELSDKIAAVGLQAGSLGVDRCNISKPVSLLHIHGVADLNHPIEGGRGTRGISGVEFRPAIEGIETIARADGCPKGAERAQSLENNLTIEVWTPCRDGAEVKFVRVAGASHAWMGHASANNSTTFEGAPYPDYDSSYEIWAFLAEHPRP